MGAITKAMVGRHHTASVQPNQMGSVFQRSNLEGKLLNLVTELNQNAELEDGMLKAIVSGEMMSVEKKHQDVREIEPFAKHIILTKHMPRIRDYSDGLFRRVSIIPLERQFLGSSCHSNLYVKGFSCCRPIICYRFTETGVFILTFINGVGEICETLERLTK